MKWRISFIALVVFAALLPMVVFAETVPQMRLRIFAEAQARQPEEWAKCDVNQRVNAVPGLLTGLSTQGKVALQDLARYTCVFDYEYAMDFLGQNKRLPGPDDWGISFPRRVEAQRYELAISPVVFEWVQEFPEAGRLWHRKPEYAFGVE
ncbi:MAG: hypothetical protein A2W25_15430 [candidate division Zixibacteria bacterium RBG_16_53_22]|nr:MAG: hypothetical protein A2W25_15430 [candidate division Zixibacteria bacterium RBG_16_53_22]